MHNTEKNDLIRPELERTSRRQKSTITYGS